MDLQPLVDHCLHQKQIYMRSYRIIYKDKLVLFQGEDILMAGDKNPVQHIKDYHIDSVSSKAKLRIIEGIIRAIAKIGFKVDTKQPIEDILKDIKKQLPDPRAGSTFVKNAEKQETVCKMIADAINQEFIDLGQDKHRYHRREPPVYVDK